MASPFEIFRKNQRVLMAAAVLIAIVSFVIAPMIEYFSGGNSSTRQGPNPVVASWKGGSVRQQQLERDQYDIQLLNRFLRDLATKVIEKGGMPAVPGFSPDLSSVGVSNSVDDQLLLQRRLWTAEAKRLGIQFDDASVKRFLQKFADGKVNGNTILSTMSSSTDRQMTMHYFSRVLKEELTYQEMLRLVSSGLVFEDVRNSRPVAAPALTTPSKNWREFLRLNRQAKVQAFPVYVKDFVAQVQNKPTDKELKELYNAGKDVVRTSNTLDSEPAFMSPAMASIEFLSVDMEKVIADEMTKFSDETLRAEYERRVAQKDFRVPIEIPKTEEKPAGTESPAPAGSTPATNSPTEAAPGSVPGTPAAEMPASEGTPTPPASVPVPATEPVPVPTPAAGEEAPKTAPSEPTDAPKPPVLEDPKAKWNARPGNPVDVVRLVSFQEEQNPPATPPAEQPPAESTPVKEIPPNPLREPQDAPKSEAEKPANEPAPSQEPVSQGSPATVTPPSESKPAMPSETEPAISVGVPEGGAQEAVAETTPMRTKTFDEVKLQIAREMAEGPAVKVVDDKINQIYSLMSVYQAERNAYLRALEEKATGVEKPSKPDLETVGKDLGLDYGTTGMVDSETVQLNPIGQSFVSRGQREQPIPVSRFIDATQGAGEAFTPLASFSRGVGASSRFLFWKTEIKERSVPSFDAVKDRVQEVWSVQQAIKLAETKARETATRIGSGKIEDILTSEDEKKLIVEPTPFTAMNPMYPLFARMGAQFQIDEVSRVDPLLPVDKSFMEIVFGAKLGETVSAPDQRKSVFYVVKILEHSPSNTELFEKFQNAPTEGVANLSLQESQRAIFPVFQDIQKRLGFRVN